MTWLETIKELFSLFLFLTPTEATDAHLSSETRSCFSNHQLTFLPLGGAFQLKNEPVWLR